MQITLTDTQQVNVKILDVKDHRGQVVPVATPPTWLTDNSELVTIKPADDGLSCLVTAKGPLGTGSVNVNVTTAGGNLTGVAEIVVTASAPTTVDLAADPPTEQTA